MLRDHEPMNSKILILMRSYGDKAIRASMTSILRKADRIAVVVVAAHVHHIRAADVSMRDNGKVTYIDTPCKPAHGAPTHHGPFTQCPPSIRGY